MPYPTVRLMKRMSACMCRAPKPLGGGRKSRGAETYNVYLNNNAHVVQIKNKATSRIILLLKI